MLRILGEQLDPSPLHPRREFLRVGALGSLGLGLPELLALQSEAHAAGSTTFGRAKRCILMHLWGASPHQDTFDLKPEAPIEVRGPFLPIPTNVPGVEIGDHLPLLARHGLDRPEPNPRDPGWTRQPVASPRAAEPGDGQLSLL